ncbi:MAG: alpha/beta fold hydrolase, partial [Granulosicoccus sp.]
FGPVIKTLEDGNEGESALRFAEAVFGLPLGGISEVPKDIQNIFSDNGRTVPSFLKMENWEHYDCAALGDIQVPQLVVQGGNSHTYFSMAAESISTCLPNSLLVTMQGATHAGPALEIERFAKLIFAFQQIVE